MTEPIRLITGFDDMAVMRESIQQRRGQLGIPEHAAPFRERQVGGNDDAGALIQLGQQVEQQGPPVCENGR